MIGAPIKLVDMARDVALDLTDNEKIALAVEIVRTVGQGGYGPTLRQAARKIEQHAHTLGRGEVPRRSNGSVIDLTGAKALAAEKKKAPKAKSYQRPTWRDTARISIPHYLISRQIRKLADRRAPVLDRVLQRLERLEERLSDKVSDLSRLQALRLWIVRWLMQSPNSEQQAIPEETHHDPSSAPTSNLAPVSDAELLKRGVKGHE